MGMVTGFRSARTCCADLAKSPTPSDRGDHPDLGKEKGAGKGKPRIRTTTTPDPHNDPRHS